ncbi:MAG: hypothetical protein AAGA48_30495, partial [Myxococcota bacterium]
MIKICGLTHPEAVQHAIDAGADAIGIVLAQGSPRTIRDPRPLLAVCKGVVRVAVFRAYTGQPVEGFDLVQAFAFDEVPPLPRLPAFRDRTAEHPGLTEALAQGDDTPIGRAVLDGPGGGGQGITAD